MIVAGTIGGPLILTGCNNITVSPDDQRAIDAARTATITASVQSNTTPTPSIEAQATSTPKQITTASATETAQPQKAVPSSTVTPQSSVEVSLATITRITPADKNGDRWVLRHPDEDKNVDISLPPGFTPAKSLHNAIDITPLALGNDWVNYQDWEKMLNTGRPVGDRLAGYNYDYNDFCMVPGFYCNVQSDLYAWRVFQGHEVRIPGIGTLIGGDRRSVMVLILNLDASVFPWDVKENGPVYVERGFTATGRIFDGTKAPATEQLLVEHWLSKQFLGESSKSYLGITDNPDNARETLLVSAQRKQWGLNPDGSKRLEFQLIRAELIRR